MNGWTDYLAVGKALQERWPDVDVVGLDNGALGEKLLSLPGTDGFGAIPDSADFVFAVKTAWLKARRSDEPDTPVEALL